MRRRDVIRVVAGLGAAFFLPKKKQTELDLIRERHNELLKKSVESYVEFMKHIVVVGKK